MKTLSLAIFLFSFLEQFSIYAQGSFAEGYFIDNEGTHFKCLIQDRDWKHNPVTFTYKIDSQNELRDGTVENVREFGIGNDLKYVRYTVKYDMTSANKYNYDRNPQWQDRTLFLQVLIEGKATLLKHKEEQYERYFYSKDGNLPEQLVYKKFLVEPPNANVNLSLSRATNNYYLAQLKVNVNCNPTEVINIPYEEKALIKQFKKFNACSGDVSEKSYERNRKTEKHFRVVAGVDFSQMTMVQPTSTSEYDIDFGSKTGLRIGLQGEFLLPFNKRKWSIPIEAMFRSYSGSDNYGFSNQQELKMEYKSIELSSGVRYNMLLSSSSKLFVSLMLVFDAPMGSSIKSSTSFQYDISSSVNQYASFGFARNKVSAEFRYFTLRNTLRKYPLVSNDFRNLSFVLGYRIR